MVGVSDAEHYSNGTAKIYAFEISHYLGRIGGEAVALQTGYGKLVRYLAALRKRYDNPATVRQSIIAGRLKSGQGLRQVQAFASHKKYPLRSGTGRTIWKRCGWPWKGSIR